MKKFCNFLIKEKVITQDQADIALLICNDENSDLLKFFLSIGIKSIDLYQSFAKFNNLSFANLYIDKCDRDLLNSLERDEYIKYSAIPWKKKNNKIILATSKLDKNTKEWANKKYGKGNYNFAITSPYDIQFSFFIFFSKEDDLESRKRLVNLEPKNSAYNLFANINKAPFYILTIIFLSSILYNPYITYICIFILINLIYIINISFKSVIIFINFLYYKNFAREKITYNIKEEDLPIYTILLPMHKEEKVVATMVDSIRKLDYPKHKLDIKFIIEEHDHITLNAIKSLSCERIFEIIIVPYSIPQTKPKACNYALKFAKGQFVTIYDADDIPEPMQLKKAIYEFQNSKEDLICVQAKLKYFNGNHNILTRLFSIEYATLFEFILPVFQLFKIPILLGGSSNHFKIDRLNQLNKWDAYNVTEDADLGLRIFRKGFKTKIIHSFTEEEAPIKISSWIKQRTRWIKGFIQTYFVHMRNPYTFYKDIGFINFLSIQIFLGTSIVVYLVSPIMWILSILFIANNLGNLEILNYNLYLCTSISIYILVIGLILQFFSLLLVIFENKWWKISYVIFIFPLYWILHSIAGFLAVVELYKKPYYWNKTEHGVIKEHKKIS